jgi:hypothetical protein
MSQKIRGEEVAIRIAVDGVVQGGSLFKLTDFSATPRTELTEDEYLGEAESDIDIQHHGWDLAFSFDHQDSVGIDLCEEIIGAEMAHQAHPNVTITVIYTYREPGARGKMAVYQKVFLAPKEESVGGRKEKVKGKFEGKCKKRSILSV